MTSPEHDRLVAAETRLADIERRIAALEEATNRLVPHWWPIPAVGGTQIMGCRVCGRGADGKAYGLVCTRSDCPNLVTCFAGTHPDSAPVGQTPTHLVGTTAAPHV